MIDVHKTNYGNFAQVLKQIGKIIRFVLYLVFFF